MEREFNEHSRERISQALTEWSVPHNKHGTFGFVLYKMENMLTILNDRFKRSRAYWNRRVRAQPVRRSVSGNGMSFASFLMSQDQEVRSR